MVINKVNATLCEIVNLLYPVAAAVGLPGAV